MIAEESRLTQRLVLKSVQMEKIWQSQVTSAKFSGRIHVGDHILSLKIPNSDKFLFLPALEQFAVSSTEDKTELTYI